MLGSYAVPPCPVYEPFFGNVVKRQCTGLSFYHLCMPLKCRFRGVQRRSNQAGSGRGPCACVPDPASSVLGFLPVFYCGINVPGT